MTAVPEPLRVAGDALASLTNLPGLARQFGELPVLLVDGPAVDAPNLVSVPAVTVLVGADDQHDQFDVVADTATAEAVVAAVRANPHAATVLVQQVRLAERLDPLSGLVTESLAYATLQGGAEFSAWQATQGRRVRPAFDTPPLRVSHEPDLLRLTLDRPRLRNALTADLRDHLVAALHGASLTNQPILIDAAGPAFCIGGDLAEFGTTTDTADAHRIRQLANVAPALLGVADRTTVRIDGPVIGAGLELAAFAHRVEATDRAFFALPEVSMGLIPGAGGTVSLTARIGRHATNRLALTGEQLDSAAALAIGLADSRY